MAESVEPEAAPLLVHGCPAEERRGATVVHVEVAGYQKLVKALRAEGYEYIVDLCAVDQLTNPTRTLPDGVAPQRFELVLNLRDLPAHRAVRVRCQVPGDDATAPSLFALYPGSEAMEREAYDLFGIVFTGHPDLTRILLPEDWEGHPLRKDYAHGKVPVQFKAPQTARQPEGAPIP